MWKRRTEQDKPGPNLRTPRVLTGERHRSLLRRPLVAPVGTPLRRYAPNPGQRAPGIDSVQRKQYEEEGGNASVAGKAPAQLQT